MHKKKLKFHKGIFTSDYSCSFILLLSVVFFFYCAGMNRIPLGRMLWLEILSCRKIVTSKIILFVFNSFLFLRQEQFLFSDNNSSRKEGDWYLQKIIAAILLFANTDIKILKNISRNINFIIILVFKKPLIFKTVRKDLTAYTVIRNLKHRSSFRVRGYGRRDSRSFYFQHNHLENLDIFFKHWTYTIKQDASEGILNYSLFY